MTLAYSRIGKKKKRHKWLPEGVWTSKHAWARKQRALAKLRKKWRRS